MMRTNEGLGTIDRCTDHISLTKSRPENLDEIEKKINIIEENEKFNLIKMIFR